MALGWSSSRKRLESCQDRRTLTLWMRRRSPVWSVSYDDVIRRRRRGSSWGEVVLVEEAV